MKNTTILLSILFVLTSPTLSYGGKEKKTPLHRKPKSSIAKLLKKAEKMREQAEDHWMKEIAQEQRFLAQARAQNSGNKIPQQ